MRSETVEDPLLRQRYRFSRQRGFLVVEIEIDPGGSAPYHFHPRLEERWEVLEGDVTFRIDGRDRAARPGDRLVVGPGTRHAFANAGEGLARLRAEVDPPLQLQEFLEGGAALNRAGKVTRRGLPRGPRAALEAVEFVERHRETVVLLFPFPFPPPALQRILFPPLARLQRRRERRRRRLEPA